MKKAIKILVILLVFITNQSCEKDNDIELTGSIEIKTRVGYEYKLYTEEAFLKADLIWCNCALKEGIITEGESIIEDLNPGTYYIRLEAGKTNADLINVNIVVQVSAGRRSVCEH